MQQLGTNGSTGARHDFRDCLGLGEVRRGVDKFTMPREWAPTLTKNRMNKLY